MAIAEYACMVCNGAHISRTCGECGLRMCNQCTCDSTIEASNHHNIVMLLKTLAEIAKQGKNPKK